MQTCLESRKSSRSESNFEIICSLLDLSKDFLCLLEHPSDFSDAVLKCDGVEIPVHKCILSARSPVFSAMFLSEMEGDQSGNVNIVDIKLSVLQVLLVYLYSGRIDSLTYKIAEGLLFAADKYGLKDLMRICTDKLKSILSLDNICRILILGDLHDIQLKAHAKEFICNCKFSDLEETEEWESLQEDYPKLAIEVLRSIVKYKQDSSHQRKGEKFVFVENICFLPELSDFLRLLDHPSNFSDAVLKCDGVEIPVHKCILSARSPVFSAMFNCQMQEGQSGNVNIVDIKLSVLQVMLKYMYSGKIDSLTDTNVKDLLFASDKYGLENLKGICSNKLKSILSVDNICQILILGDLHDIHLKAHAKEFICKCKFSSIEKTEEWESLQEEYPKLAMEVLRSIVNYVQILLIQVTTYKIAVRYMGKIISLDVPAIDTIENVKKKIQVKEGIPPHRQRLYLESRLLQDCNTISDYDINNHSNLTLINFIEIFVRTRCGKTITLPILDVRSCTIKDVKVKIQLKRSISPDFQRLFYVNKLLKDEKTLFDYNIVNYSTLDLNLWGVVIKTHSDIVTRGFLSHNHVCG